MVNGSEVGSHSFLFASIESAFMLLLQFVLTLETFAMT